MFLHLARVSLSLLALIDGPHFPFRFRAGIYYVISRNNQRQPLRYL